MAGATTLLLNASYEPLRVVPWQRAVTMLCLGKVEVVRSYDVSLRAVSWTVEMPAVIRLLSFVRRHRVRVALSRRNVFVRDRHTCQYCGGQLGPRDLTCDHVIPRSQGGGMTWENVVTACGPCNRKKGGRTPEQAHMKLRRVPRQPRYLPVLVALNVASRSVPEPWLDFIGHRDAIEAIA